MLELQKKFNHYGSLFVKKLQENHIKAGQKTTGESYNAFGFESTATSLTVFGADHVEHLERGRGAGGFPNITDIRTWAEAKGLLNQFQKEYQKRSFVFLVARKIANEGTYLHRLGKTFNGFKNPINSVFDKKTIDDMVTDLGKSISEDIQLTVKKEFETFKYKSQ